MGMRRRPLAFCSLALAAGILIAPSGPSPGSWSAMAITFLAGGIALVGRSEAPARLAAPLLLLGFGCLGALEREVSARVDPSDVGAIVSLHPSILGEGVEVRGVIARAPRRCPERLAESPCLDLTVDLTALTRMRIAGLATGRVQLRVAGLAVSTSSLRDTLRRGDRIRAHARLFVPHVYADPGSFDTVRHLRATGIRALGTVKSPRLVHVTVRDDPGPLLLLLRSVDDLGGILSSRIEDSLAGSPSGARAAAVGRALLLGDTAHLDPDDTELLRRAGVSHLLAVSGFHVGVLAGTLLLLARALRVARRWRLSAVLPVLLIYLTINHAHSSLDRAVAMATLTFAGRAVWRPPDPFNSMGLALLLLLGRVPDLIHEAGFQLTFVATASLMLGLGRSRGPDTGRLHGPIPQWVRRAGLATLAVLMGTLPLCIVHFNRVTPGAILGNLLMGPLVALVMILILVLEILVILPGGLHVPVAAVIVHLVGWGFSVAGALGSVPFLSYRRIIPGLVVSCLYYASVVALLRGRGPRAMRIAASGVLAVTGTILLLPLDSRAAPEGLRVTFLDVGQGDAALIETPGGDRVLVDAGGRTPNGFDIGERVVSRALWSLGIASIDILVVTHPDADHVGGAAAIVRNFDPRRVLVPTGSRSWIDRKAARPLRRALVERGTAMTEVSAGFSACLTGGRLQVLHPPRAVEGFTGNERSIVLRLTSEDRTVLMPGDAGVATEETLASRLVEADILKAGHHGSRTASSNRFLDRVRPGIVIISCGRRNRFGHPHPEVLASLEENARIVFRTDRDGSIEILLTRAGTRLDRPPIRRGRDAG